MQRIRFCFKIYLLTALAGIFFIEGKSQQTGLSISSGSPALKVMVRQELQLGTFTQGSSGGSIVISPDGFRTGNGTVVPLNFGAAYAPLILEIEGPKGSIVSMLANETTVLTGSNGGVMRLKITESSPPLPFVIREDPPAKHIIKIGAELKVGNSIESPPGNYSGSLNISFIME